MLNKWASILSPAILTMVISFYAELAFAGDYSVNWWMAKKISRENGEAVNRLAFDRG